MTKVGVPRALSYYRYYPLWKVFLEGLGLEVVLSRHTGKRLLEDGVRHCVDDICVPVKLYFGHLLDLKDRVDVLFVSRIVSVEKDQSETYTCPKLIGLPDMVRGSLDDLPEVVEFVIDMQNRSLRSSARRLGALFGKPGALIRRSLNTAMHVQARYEEALLSGLDPESAMETVLGNGGGPARADSLGPGREGEQETLRKPDLRIALVGHEYLIHDPFISHNLPRKLQRMGADVLYASQVSQSDIAGELSLYPGISWSYEKELLGAASHFLSRGDIDGVMIVICFACGPDSIVTEIIEREVLSESSPPVSTLVLDEHTGEAGVATRVEAFLDLIRRSR